MPDVVGSKATLLALFPSNQSKDIGSDDHRRFVVTALGVYAHLATLSSQTLASITTTAQKLTTWDTNGPADDMTVSHSGDTITAATAGLYLLNFSACIAHGSTQQITFEFRINGTATGVTCSCHALSTEVRGVSMSAILSLAVNDVLTVYVKAGAGSSTITVHQAHLTAKMIG